MPLKGTIDSADAVEALITNRLAVSTVAIARKYVDFSVIVIPRNALYLSIMINSKLFINSNLET